MASVPSAVSVDRGDTRRTAVDLCLVVLREHEATLRLAAEIEDAGGVVEFYTDLLQNPDLAEEIGMKPGLRERIFGLECTKQIVGVRMSPAEPITARVIDLLNRAKTIRYLDIDADVDDETFLSLAPNPELRGLSLHRLTITDRSMQHLRDFPRLQSLDLREAFDLREAPIFDAGLSSLAGLQYLAELDVNITGVTGNAIPLGTDLPRLRKINVAGTDWTDEAVQRLATIQTLEEVDLAHTGVTDRSLAILAKLPRLCDLTIDNTQITGAGFCHLAEMPALERLDASELRLSDDAFAAMATARIGPTDAASCFNIRHRCREHFADREP